MNTLPLFYKKVVPLNKTRHKDLRITPPKDYKHTRGTNSLYIAAVEFLNAAREYPIVFGKGSDGVIFPLLLLGLKNTENLYVGKKGEWLAGYIPAYVRRYPFILATDNKNSGNFTVCIDESYPGFSNKKTGTRLFNEDGSESSLLKQSVEFLKGYQTHVQLTTKFCNTINELNLLEPMQANLEKSGKKQRVTGFMCVNRKRLNELATEKLATLFRDDHLELIYAHLHSLLNMEVLLKR